MQHFVNDEMLSVHLSDFNLLACVYLYTMEYYSAIKKNDFNHF